MDPYTATVAMITEIIKANTLMVESMTPEQRQQYYAGAIALQQVWADLLHKIASAIPHA